MATACTPHGTRPLSLEPAMSLRNMNIAPRALSGFACIGALMIILGIFALVQMGSIRKAGEEIENNTLPSLSNLGQITQMTLRLRVLSYRLLPTVMPRPRLKPCNCWTRATN